MEDGIVRASLSLSKTNAPQHKHTSSCLKANKKNDRKKREAVLSGNDLFVCVWVCVCVKKYRRQCVKIVLLLYKLYLTIFLSILSTRTWLCTCVCACMLCVYFFAFAFVALHSAFRCTSRAYAVFWSSLFAGGTVRHACLVAASHFV